MAAKMEKTRTPGVYKRGSRYVFAYRVDGRQRWESCRTLDEARRAKAARATDIGRGEFEERSRITLQEYAREWIERYQGTGRRGFREETRSEYRGLLDKYALSHFPSQTKLTDITPRHIASFVGWLCEQTKPAATKEDPDRRCRCQTRPCAMRSDRSRRAWRLLVERGSSGTTLRPTWHCPIGHEWMMTMPDHGPSRASRVMTASRSRR